MKQFFFFSIKTIIVLFNLKYCKTNINLTIKTNLIIEFEKIEII